ncbi:HAMP domain-containing histidine kinase [Chitinophaga agrisoli]|uniref:histidine kinase n=1 Tax=Chitinophaga agrisoli TaxID=2607653 RepID=A0A5B2W3P7_9BACT|nr:HAMP domain-containing sensor histidine kinase [Chitinophaga agrisoli]KAA2245478.1 HAMP domain-containing histidine kinase [Chitinophaga agrisoli]
MFSIFTGPRRTKHSKIKELQEQLAQMDEFIRIWSHDINMPIMALNNGLKALKAITTVEDLAVVLGDLMYIVGYLEEINSNIRTFMNGEHYERLHIKRIDLLPWLRQIVSLYAVVASYKRQKIELFAPEAGTIDTDDIKLSQIIFNLLSNAVKYTPIEGHIYVNLYNKDDITVFEVQDDGIGIPASQMDNIWLPHTRLENNVPGLGIGLFVCKKNTKLLGGDITVSSHIGEGTLVTVKIPAQKG